MAKSSRHKSSHKQSKHSSKEDRDYSSDSEEDVKVKGRTGKGESSVRVSRDYGVGEKRKVSSQSRDGHGDAAEELGSSKRRKDGADELEDGAVAVSEKVLKSGSSRLESEKSSKSSKSKVDSRSRNSRRSENGSDRKEEIVEIVEIVDEELGSKLKDVKENDLGRIKAAAHKDKERGSEKDRKAKEKKQQDAEKHTDYIEVKKKQKSRSNENTEQPKQDDLGNTHLEKDLEKQAKSRDGSVEKDAYADNKRGNEDRKLSTRREHAKDGRYKEDKQIDVSYRDSCRDDVDRESRHKYGKRKEETNDNGRNKDGRHKGNGNIDDVHKYNYKDEVDKESRHIDGEHKEEINKDGRNKDGRYKEDKHIDGIYKDSYRDDVDLESRHRDGKHREETDRDSRHKGGRDKEDKHFDLSHKDSYGDDIDRESRHRGSKHKEETDRDGRHKDVKHIEKDGRYKDGRQRENYDQKSRYKDGKQRDDFDKDGGHKDDRHGEDFDEDGRRRDCKRREDGDKEKRYREDKYRDEYALRDYPIDKSDAKRMRDESSHSESRSRKSKSHYVKCDSSPVYSDQDIKHGDDKRTRRFDHNEDKSDLRSRKTKDQYSDARNKSMDTIKTHIVTDKERHHSRNADADSNATRISHGDEDKFRCSKQEESKYRDSSPEEKVTHDMNSYVDITGSFGISEKASMSQMRERLNGEDDGYKHEFSSERYLKPDVRTSPGQQVVDSTSSGIHQIHMAEAGVRHSSDVEEFGQKNKDARGLLSNKSKRGSDLPLETPSVVDIPQVDGGNFSSSSPTGRTTHLPSNSRPRFRPSPSFRSSKDGHSPFGSFEEDNRGRSNNRYKRSGSSNMGRSQGNAWGGVPNWSSPVTGNFIHFQNGPPSVGFHPMMQQFSGPPMFGIRPLMEFTHSGGPYPIPDANGFSSHGHPCRWPNPMGDSCPPLSHGWDVKNGGEAHIYGRLDWDHNRSPMNHQGWGASADIMKGQSSHVTMELPSTTDKEDSSVHTPSDNISVAQSIQQTRNDLNELDFQAEKSEICQSSDALAKETYTSPNTGTTTKPYPSNMSQNVDDCYYHAYLSKLDISADLSHPDLYDKCTSLMGMKQTEIATEDSSRFSYIEGVIQARVKISKLSSNSSLFVAINDSVHQKAMQLYKKQQEETSARLTSLSNAKNNYLHTANNMEASADTDLDKAVSLVSISPSPAVPCEKEDSLVAANSPEELAEPIPSVGVAELALDDEEKTHSGVEDEVSVIQASEFAPSEAHYMEEDFGIKVAGNIKEPELLDSMSGPLPFSDACEKVMGGSLECELVKLTRIHDLTGSTH